MTPAVVGCYLICALVWGTTWFVIRESTLGVPLYFAAALRFSVAFVVLALAWLVGIGRERIRWQSAQWLIAAGLVNGTGFLLLYFAEQKLPGGLVAVIFGTASLMTAFIAARFGLEIIRPNQVLGSVISVIGIAVISYGQLLAGVEHGLSLIAAFVAVMLAVWTSICIKRGMKEVHPITGTMIFVFTMALLTWSAAMIDPHPWIWPLPLRPVLGTIYLALAGSVIAFGCYFYLLKHVSLMVANSLVLVEPLIALLVDAAFERRAILSTVSYAGITIVLIGIALTLYRKPGAQKLIEGL